MKISLIAAVAENNVIGAGNDLIWHLPADMKYFKDTTMGHHVLMGRKNYLSIPERFRPFSGRENIVVSRNPEFGDEGIHVYNNIPDAIQHARAAGEEELFIIGGGQIYAQSMELADELYITWVKEKFEGDAYFPEIDLDQWQLKSQSDRLSDERNPHDMSFCVYSRRQ